MLVLLPTHGLLNYVVDLVWVRFVEDGWVLSCWCWMMVWSWTAVQRTLWICRFRSILAHHLSIVRAQPVLVLVMVLVKLDHRKFLLQWACTLLLHSHSLLHVLVISTLVITCSLNHITIICTVFLRISLVAWRWICQSHRSLLLLAIWVTAIYITIAVTIYNLISIYKD